MSDTNEPLLDKLGQEIKRGCWIIYGHALGRCAGLRIGMVLDVKRGEPDNQFGTPCPWNREDRITVWGLDDDQVEFSRYHPEDEWARPKPLTKKSTLLFSSRVVVVDTALVPQKYREQIVKLAPGIEVPPRVNRVVEYITSSRCGNCSDPTCGGCQDPMS